MRLFFTIFVYFTRPIKSFIFYNLVRFTFKKHDFWKDYKYLPLENFNRIMNGVEYKRDPLWGRFDYTVKDPNYFFNDINLNKFWFGRDCEDIAHMWYLYAKEKDIPAQKLNIFDGSRPFSTGHAVCLLYNQDGRIVLCDKVMVKEFNEIDDVVRYLKHTYKYKDIIHVLGRVKP